MKYTIVFTQTIHHCAEVEADNFSSASELASQMVSNGEVEFTQDDIASAYDPVDYFVIK